MEYSWTVKNFYILKRIFRITFTRRRSLQSIPYCRITLWIRKHQRRNFVSLAEDLAILLQSAFFWLHLNFVEFLSITWGLRKKLVSALQKVLCENGDTVIERKMTGFGRTLRTAPYSMKEVSILFPQFFSIKILCNWTSGLLCSQMYVCLVCLSQAFAS